MTDHPSRDELLAVVRGGLTPQRAGAILAHLYRGCETCLAAAPTVISAWFGVEREPTAEENADTEAAIDRAFAFALRENRSVCQRKARVAKAAKILTEGGLAGPEKFSRSMNQIDKFEALLAASWALRHEDTGLMIFFTRLALECAEQLDPRKHGVKQVSDLQCRAQAELGNAYRVSDQLSLAQSAMSRARNFFELGTRNEILEIRLLDLEASLCIDLRQPADACINFKKIYTHYRRNGNLHQAGRMLVQIARCTRQLGNLSAALGTLRESLKFIDGERDPILAYTARHNEISILLDLGRFRDAEKCLFFLRSKRQFAGGRINDLRFRWEEGRIEAGFNRLDRAESAFREISAGFLEVNRAYDSALASLDLAAVLLAQRKAQEAKDVVAAAYKVFMALDIQREGLMTVLLLRTACEMRAATRESAERVARYLRRLQNDPKAKFEDEA